MKILLLKNIKNLGNFGEIVTVKNGYANNYLIPSHIAITATKKNIKEIKKEDAYTENSINKKIIDEEKEVNEINNLNIILPVTTKNNENIYGSINNNKIFKVFKSLGINIKKQNIDKNLLIKKTGNYKILLTFKKNLQATIFLMVVKNKM